MHQGSFSKCCRVLDLYTRLNEGQMIVKRDAAVHYGINERSVQRDIDDIRAFLDNRRLFEPQDTRQIIYDRSRKGFIMQSRGEI